MSRTHRSRRASPLEDAALPAEGRVKGAGAPSSRSRQESPVRRSSLVDSIRLILCSFSCTFFLTFSRKTGRTPKGTTSMLFFQRFTLFIHS